MITIIIFILIILFYFLLLHGSLPEKSNFDIDFIKVRQLAEAKKDELIKSIHLLTIATGELPAWGVVAGDFFTDKSKIEFPCFLLANTDKTIIIEAPYNQRLFKKFPYGKDYLKNNYELMQKALLDADMILATHEHWDHVGGIAQSHHLDKILKKVILTKEQIEGRTITDAEFPNGIFKNYRPLNYDKYHCITPGIVLIKTPGHSTGHQFIFVKLQNGIEFLFTGDVVWTNRNFEKHKNRPWLASIKRLENRKQIAHQMQYLYDEFYNNENQKILLMSTHDTKQHEDYINKGLINKNFKLHKETK